MIQQYLDYLRTLRGFGNYVAKATGNDLQDFVQWISSTRNNPTWSTITRADINDYAYNLATRGMTPASINRRLIRIEGLYRYFKHNGLKTKLA